MFARTREPAGVHVHRREFLVYAGSADAYGNEVHVVAGNLPDRDAIDFDALYGHESGARVAGRG
jgi:hypothetical protein